MRSMKFTPPVGHWVPNIEFSHRFVFSRFGVMQEHLETILRCPYNILTNVDTHVNSSSTIPQESNHADEQTDNFLTYTQTVFSRSIETTITAERDIANEKESVQSPHLTRSESSTRTHTHSNKRRYARARESSTRMRECSPLCWVVPSRKPEKPATESQEGKSELPMRATPVSNLMDLSAAINKVCPDFQVHDGSKFKAMNIFHAPCNIQSLLYSQFQGHRSGFVACTRNCRHRFSLLHIQLQLHQTHGFTACTVKPNYVWMLQPCPTSLLNTMLKFLLSIKLSPSRAFSWSLKKLNATSSPL
nr:hypothetical protein Iba_chr14dCG15380 [Ipomoea batatas]